MDLKRLRFNVDAVLNTSKKLLPSRETSLVITNLQLAFSWLGEALKASGSTSPYTESQNHKSTTIEAVADHDDNNFIAGLGEVENTQTAKVKFLRAAIETHLVDFKNEREKEGIGVGEYNDCLNNFWRYYKNAKIWLGWELGRIKKELDAQA